jgi:mannose-6-phosphate isomerase-like protein (cupin superfamily)
MPARSRFSGCAANLGLDMADMPDEDDRPLVGHEIEARPHPLVVPLDALEHTRHAHELEGADHGGVPFSVILVHSQPGIGPKLHRHPYAEVFVVESGEATFQLGADTVVVPAGHVVIGPPDVPHGFTNSGRGQLRLVAIHGAPRFNTEWLAGDDPAWTSKPRDPGATP